MSTMFIQNDPGPALTDITVLRRLDMTSETGWGGEGGVRGHCLTEWVGFWWREYIYVFIYVCVCVCVCNPSKQFSVLAEDQSPQSVSL